MFNAKNISCILYHFSMWSSIWIFMFCFTSNQLKCERAPVCLYASICNTVCSSDGHRRWAFSFIHLAICVRDENKFSALLYWKDGKTVALNGKYVTMDRKNNFRIFNENSLICSFHVDPMYLLVTNYCHRQCFTIHIFDPNHFFHFLMSVFRVKCFNIFFFSPINSFSLW